MSRRVSERRISAILGAMCLVAFLAMAAAAKAQTLTTGAITGTVLDPSGAVVPKVVVTATNVNTGATRTVMTNQDGQYLIPQLDPGDYRVAVQSSGFATAEIGPVTVAVSRIATVNLNLKVGSATEKVVVNQNAPLIEPSNPNTTTTLNATQLAEIPNPGNDLSYVATLAPGAIINTGTTNQGGFGNVEFNGLPDSANNFSIDGLDANNPYFNTNASGASRLQLGLNAIEEVTINTASYSVDQGRQDAAQINYITKSGTNGFHGNAYEIWNGSALNARNFFNNLKGIKKKPRSNVNEFGASVGGPVLKNKLFFFTDLEGIRIVLPVTLTSTLPTPAYQTYVLQQLPLGGIDTVFNFPPASPLPPQPGEVPLYQNMFKLMGDTSGGIPLAVLGCPFDVGGGSPATANDGNGCATRKTFSVAPPVSETLFTTKVDYTLSSKDSFWFRFQLNNGKAVSPDAVNSIFDGVTSGPVRSGAAGWTHIFGPSLVNQFNPGRSYNKNVFNIADPSKAQALFPITYAGGTLAPFSAIGGSQSFAPAGSANTVWQLNDNLAWNLGRHNLKFGENLRRVLISAFARSLNKIPNEFACTLPEFTFGATCITTQSFPKTVADRIASVNFDVYAMDTFRATDKLTFTIGVRTAWNSNPVSRHNAFSRLAGSFETISHDVNQPLNQVILSNQTEAFSSTQLLQWQPRAALAYGVMPKTVLRAGFGIFSATLQGAQAPSELSQNPPLDPVFSGGIFGVGGTGIIAGVPNSAVDAAVAANQQFQANFAGGALSCASALSSPGTCVPPVNTFAFAGGEQKYPYSMQWSSSIERQFGNDFGVTVRYLGTRAVKLQYFVETLNSFQTWCQGCFAPAPFKTPLDPRFGEVDVLNTGANSSYHALQVTGQKRMSHGLTFQVNYTYSHCLDSASNGGFTAFNVGAGSGNYLLTPVDFRRYYGNCDYDVRHSLNGSYLYELPFHSASSWLNGVVGGWQVSGTVFLRDGFPFAVYSSGMRLFNGFTFPLANVITGVDPYSKTNIPGVTQPGTIQWLNPDAFRSVIDTSTGTCFPVTNAQNCQEGNSERNAFRAPGFKWTDFAIDKRFKISERLSLKFGAQFYNVFNHPNFFSPATFPSNLAGIPGKPQTQTGFGSISQTAQPSTGLLGGRLGDSSVRMIALRGRIEF